MTFDLTTETYMTLSEAAELLPGRPAVSTIWRWHLRGVRGVKLQTCMIGGRRYTSRHALEEFAARTTAAADGEPLPARSPKQRERAIQIAERELSAGRNSRK